MGSLLAGAQVLDTIARSIGKKNWVDYSPFDCRHYV